MRWSLRWATPVMAMLASVALAIGFAFLGSEVKEGETRSFDAQVLRQAMVVRATHAGFAEAMRDLSGVGSTVTLTLLTLGTCGFLGLVGQRRRAMLVAASIGSAALLVSALKLAFGRSRPDIAFADYVQSGLSFPSGHASMSAVVFLTLGALLAAARARRSERAYILSSAAVVTLLVGTSRAALGVHWATDVIGGWAFGTSWAVSWLLLARRLGAAVQDSAKGK